MIRSGTTRRGRSRNKDRSTAVRLCSCSDCQKSGRALDNGKEDNRKETQEGCLSGSIISFSELLEVQKNLLSVSKRLFDTQSPRHPAGASDCRKSGGTLNNGKEDNRKETQEGCLSGSIISFSELLEVQKNLLSVSKRLFDTQSPRHPAGAFLTAFGRGCR